MSRSSAARVSWHAHRVLPVAVLALAAVLRFWTLWRPDVLVFDELYYVRDAISQLEHGAPTVWPDSNPSMSAGRATQFSDEPSLVAHPPLGKWLIGLGVLAFGADSGLGWRVSIALAGVLTVAVTMRLGVLLSGSVTVAATAGLLLAVDGVHVVLSRVALLDGFLTLAVVAGALCIWRDRTRAGPGRAWLWLAAVWFGAAAGIKWSGVYALLGFALFTVVGEVFAARRLGASRRASARRSLVPWLLAGPIALGVYLLTWLGWIVNPDAWGRRPGESWFVSLTRYHVDMLSWHATLSDEHPFQSSPISWPLGLRPTAMLWDRVPCGNGSCVSVISPIPNPVVTWFGVAALLALAVLLVRAVVRRRARGRSAGAFPAWVPATAFILTGYLSGWLPWLLTVSRSAVFQFYTVVLTPFSALALAVVIGLLTGRISNTFVRVDASPEAVLGRRLSAAILLGAALALGLFFFPLWAGIPVPEWFWRAHLWLPGWS